MERIEMLECEVAQLKEKVAQLEQQNVNLTYKIDNITIPDAREFMEKMKLSVGRI